MKAVFSSAALLNLLNGHKESGKCQHRLYLLSLQGPNGSPVTFFARYQVTGTKLRFAGKASIIMTFLKPGLDFGTTSSVERVCLVCLWNGLSAHLQENPGASVIQH